MVYTRGVTTHAIGYIRVSTDDQADHGASLEAQRTALRAEADRRGASLDILADEGASGKTMNRPALQDALARLDAGQADALMAVRLDRLSRSVADFAGLLDRANRKDWTVVMLSPNIDTADPAGRFTSNVLAAAAQYERDLIGVRTSEGMRQRQAEGVRMGRPSGLDTVTVQRIMDAREAGQSLNAIAHELTAEGVPTAQGGLRWYAGTVRKVLQGQDAVMLPAA